MSEPVRPALTRRERQIMEILYRRKRATASDVRSGLSGQPHYSTVRTSCSGESMAATGR